MAMTDLGNLTGSGGAIFDPTNGYSLSNLYKQVYTDLIRLQIQQYDSVLSDTLMGETIEGEVKSFDKYLKHDVSKIKTRARFGELGTTGNEYSQTDSERRLIEPLFFEYSELFDPRDEVGLLRAIAPDGQYLRNIGAIFNQKKDLLILDALVNDVLVQTRTGDGVTASTTMAYGTKDGDFVTGAAVVGCNGAVSAKGGYDGFEIGCKLAKKPATRSATPHLDKTPFLRINLNSSATDAGSATDGSTAITANLLEIAGAGVDCTAADVTTGIGEKGGRFIHCIRVQRRGKETDWRGRGLRPPHLSYRVHGTGGSSRVLGTADPPAPACSQVARRIFRAPLSGQHLPALEGGRAHDGNGS